MSKFHRNIQDFYRPISIHSLKRIKTVKEFKASKRECALLAERLKLLFLKNLSGKLEISKEDQKRIKIRGQVRADYSQSCIITLGPIHTNKISPLSILLTKDFDEYNSHDDSNLYSDTHVEYLESDEIDCGELLVQTLAGLIDPYPRSRESTLNQNQMPSTRSKNNDKIKQMSNPFEILKTLK